MNKNSTQAINRLVKKLSAVRATLNSDEQALLDQIILNAVIDTDAPRAASAALDVAAHSMAQRAVSAKTSAKTSDVSAHSVNAGVASAKSRAKKAFRIVFSETDGYRVAR